MAPQRPADVYSDINHFGWHKWCPMVFIIVLTHDIIHDETTTLGLSVNTSKLNGWSTWSPMFIYQRPTDAYFEGHFNIICQFDHS